MGSDENNKAGVQSDSEGEMTLGEMAEVARRERSAAIYEREEATMGGRMSFNPYRKDWAPKSLSKRGKKSNPREISSKTPVPFGRDRCLGIDNGTGKGRSVKMFDPRFEHHCGELREEHVERNYAFTKGLREKERRALESAVTKGGADEHTVEQLQRMTQEDIQRKAHARRRHILKAVREEEKEAVRRGKTPYFLKEKHIRQLETKARFEHLKQSGGVKKFIEKRRRKMATKDRKLLPTRRSSQ